MEKHKPMGELHPFTAPKRPWEHITMDFFFDLPTAKGGFNGVFLVVDRFSKLVKLIPTNKRVTASQAAGLYLRYIYCNFGLPASIVSDQDTRFDSEFWTTLWKLTGTTIHMGAARHPETNGQSEKTIQTVKQILRMYLNRRGANWLEWLPMAEFWYNSATHSSTGKSPFEIVQGRNPRNPVSASLEEEGWEKLNEEATGVIKNMKLAQQLWTELEPGMEWRKRKEGTTTEEVEVRERLKQNQLKMKKQFDKKRRKNTIKKGDWVRVKKEKFPQRVLP